MWLRKIKKILDFHNIKFYIHYSMDYKEAKKKHTGFWTEFLDMEKTVTVDVGHDSSQGASALAHRRCGVWGQEEASSAQKQRKHGTVRRGCGGVLASCSEQRHSIPALVITPWWLLPARACLEGASRHPVLTLWLFSSPWSFIFMYFKFYYYYHLFTSYAFIYLLFTTLTLLCSILFPVTFQLM